MSETHVECIFEVEIIVTVEVPSNKFVYLRLRRGMQILELVHGLELNDVETIRENTIRLALEKVLGFVSGDVRNRSEHVGAV